MVLGMAVGVSTTTPPPFPEPPQRLNVAKCYHSCPSIHFSLPQNFDHAFLLRVSELAGLLVTPVSLRLWCAARCVRTAGQGNFLVGRAPQPRPP